MGESGGFASRSGSKPGEMGGKGVSPSVIGLSSTVFGSRKSESAVTLEGVRFS